MNYRKSGKPFGFGSSEILDGIGHEYYKMSGEGKTMIAIDYD